jgi:formamidase
MNGLGGLNKSPNGVVIGLVQLQLPVVATKPDLAKQTERIVWMVGKARRNLSTMDLVVFPEYSLHGLSMDTNPEIMCRLDGPEVAAFKKACTEHKIWGCFSIMEFNPDGNPYNSGLTSTITARSSCTTENSILGFLSSPGSPATSAFL